MTYKVRAAKATKISLADRRSSCPISATLDLIGDKWTLLVIRDLLFLGEKKFGDFSAAPECISTNILTDRLRNLEAYGIIGKRAYQSNPVRYSYFLTQRGRRLKPLLLEMISWGNKNIQATYTPTDEDLVGA